MKWPFSFSRRMSSSMLLIVMLTLSHASIATELSFITIDVAPWASINKKTGDIEGAFVEIVKEISTRIDRKIDITITPFARVDRELESGLHDCTILVPRSEDLVVKGNLISYHPIGVIPRKDIVLKNYEDLKDVRLSVLRGATMTPQFDSDTTLLKEYDTDYVIGLRKVSRKRLDAIVGAIPTIMHVAEEEGIADQMGEPLVLTEVPLIFQCSKNSPNLAIMPAINQAIEEIKAEGILKKIQARYYF